MSSGTKKPGQNITVALILIALGVYFLLQQLGIFTLQNWWALFILIPVFGAAGSAITIWNRAGRLSYAGWTTLYGGAFPLVVALIFLLGLDWAEYWPVFIILAGFGALLNSLPFPQAENASIPESILFHRGWSFFIGLGALVLGFGFLGLNLGWFDTVPYIPFEQWWGVPILIAAFGGVFTAARLLFAGKSIWLVGTNLVFAFAAGLAGVVAILDMDWETMQYVAPAVLVLAGIAFIMRGAARKE